MNGNHDSISVDPQIWIQQVIAPERIVVINLDRRPDRWASLLDAWDPSIANSFIRHSATDGRTLPEERVAAYAQSRDVPLERAAGELGCRDSWISAVSEQGPGLYFEDDARPCALWPFGSPPNTAEIVLLGGELWKKTDAPGWITIPDGANGTHAVWIRTERAAEKILEAWQRPRKANGPVDLTWRSALKECRAVIAVPQLICQADDDTDVQIGRVFYPGLPQLTDPWCSLARARQRA